MEPKEYMVYNSSCDDIPEWYDTLEAATTAMELEAKQDPGATIFIMTVVKSLKIPSY